MMKKLLPVLLFILSLAVIGCQSRETDDFGIYLLAEEMPATQLAGVDIETLALQDDPVIGIDDIITYDGDTHVVQLTEAAYRRVQDLFPLPLPVNGIPFVVRVGKDAIYTGAFWTPASSLSYDGVIILQPFDGNQTLIGLALGYPGRQAFTGDDPRADPRVIDKLDEAGKLK